MKPLSPILFVMCLCCSPGLFAQTDCESSAGMDFVCNALNAEDLVQVPGTSSIISSGLSEGKVFLHIDTQTNVLTPLSFNAALDAQAFPDCSQPPNPQTMNTHGLNIRASGPDRARLNVVSHVAREAIEIFDVRTSANPVQLTWVGCVLMPEGLAANSVASLDDGTLLATVLFMPGMTFADAVVDQRDTGAVFEWKPGSAAFTKIEGSELPANNGIEFSADGSRFYVVSSGFQNVVAFSYANPTQQLGSTGPLPFTPDNVHLGPDGMLYTAGMANDVPECGGPPGPEHDLAILAACPRGTIAAAIDPATMSETIVLRTEATAAFSNATMVLPIGDRFWIGSFSGDRIAHTQRQAQ